VNYRANAWAFKELGVTRILGPTACGSLQPHVKPGDMVVADQVVPRQMTELTLAFDHRVCDGGTAGGFLRFIADCVESPANALRHL